MRLPDARRLDQKSDRTESGGLMREMRAKRD
jgi:hypothetical protein